MWTEETPEEMADFRILPRLSAMAEALWLPAAARDFGDFRGRLDHLLSRLWRRGHVPGFAAGIPTDEFWWSVAPQQSSRRANRATRARRSC